MWAHTPDARTHTNTHLALQEAMALTFLMQEREQVNICVSGRVRRSWKVWSEKWKEKQKTEVSQGIRHKSTESSEEYITSAYVQNVHYTVYNAGLNFYATTLQCGKYDYLLSFWVFGEHIDTTLIIVGSLSQSLETGEHG